jgi:hypothetical protein
VNKGFNLLIHKNIFLQPKDFISFTLHQSHLQIIMIRWLWVLFIAHLFVLTVQVPAVSCASTDYAVLEIQEIEDCSDKHVCKLNCGDYIKDCNFNTYLDLTNLIKNQDHKAAYNMACSGYTITGHFLDSKLSLYFRKLVGVLTKYTQTEFYNTYHAYTKIKNKFPNLYKTSFKKVKKLTGFTTYNQLQWILSFERIYVNKACKRSTPDLALTIRGTYHYLRALMGLKKICEKKYKNSRNKESKKKILKMIVYKIHQEVANSKKLYKKTNKCGDDYFCQSNLYFSRIKNKKWKKVFIQMKRKLNSIYSHNLAKHLLNENSNPGRYFCSCQLITRIQTFLGKPRFAYVTKKFSPGYSVTPFVKYVNSYCRSKCSSQEDEEDEDLLSFKP